MTIEPYKDGDFSEHTWPDGWQDIDPFESYRSLFDGEVSASDNYELILHVVRTVFRRSSI